MSLSLTRVTNTEDGVVISHIRPAVQYLHIVQGSLQTVVLLQPHMELYFGWAFILSRHPGVSPTAAWLPHDPMEDGRLETPGKFASTFLLPL